MKISILASALGFVSMALSLSACSGGAPGDADVREAMAKQIEAISGKQGVESQKAELDKIKVGKCVSAELGGFTCEFTAGAGTQTARFKKGDKGWDLVGVGAG